MPSQTASSISLISFVTSSDSDYHSCLEEMSDKLESSSELPSIGLESEESMLLLENDDWPSIVQIYSIPSSASPSASPLPPLPFFFLCSVDQSVQSDEHEPNHLRDGATLVVWDPKLRGSFPPASHMSILPAWWRSTKCYSTFGEATYMKLSETTAIGGSFLVGDPRSDDMEGLPVWNPLAPEMPQQQWHRLNLIRTWRTAVLEEAAAHLRAEVAEAAEEAAAVADTEATTFLSDNPSDSDEDLWEPAPFRTPPIVTRVPLLPPGFGWGEGGFIPGHGFVQHPVRPALRAQAPVLRPQTPPAPRILAWYQLLTPTHSAPSGLVPGYPSVSPLQAVLRMGLFEYFPDIITTELIEELGLPPYLPHIAAWLPASFLLSPEEEQESTSSSDVCK